MENTDSTIAVIANDLSYIKRDIADIKNRMSNDYVTREEFLPVRNMAYGFAALVMTSFVLAIVALVFKPHA